MGNFAPPGTSGNVWKYLWLGGATVIEGVGSRGVAKHSQPPQQRILHPKCHSAKAENPGLPNRCIVFVFVQAALMVK